MSAGPRARESFDNVVRGPEERAEGVPNPVYCAEYGDGIWIDVPSIGETKEDCGVVARVLECPECDYKQPVGLSCMRKVCRICWIKWAYREAERIKERIDGFRIAYKKKFTKRLGNLKHIVLSPPQDRDISTLEDIKKLREEANKIAKKARLRGWITFFHPYRVRKDIKKRLLEATGLAEENKKFWAAIREDYLKLGSLKEYVYKSPHFHLLGWGDIPSSGKLFTDTEWIYRFIRHVSGDKDLFNVVVYLLSHSGVVEGLNSITWCGGISYNKMRKVAQHTDKKPVLCPNCDSEMSITNILTGESEKAVKTVITYSYRLNVPPAQRKINLDDEGGKT